MKPGQSWRSLFRGSEDLLTATVFERLAYLNGALFWRLLTSTAKPSILPKRHVAELQKLTFWPRWNAAHSASGQGWTEPDAVLDFEIGDPPERVVLIVEAKLGGLQTAEQWAREWIAYERENAGYDRPARTFLLAIGDFRLLNARRIEALTADASKLLESFSSEIPVQAVGVNWSDLLIQVRKERDGSENHTRRVLDDIESALTLYGFRDYTAVESFASEASAFMDLDAMSILALQRRVVSFYAPNKQANLGRSLVGWAASTSVLRPIGNHRL